MIHDFEFCFSNLVTELHKLVMSLLRFGFRRLEKHEDGRKEVEERHLGSQEVEEKNQTASKETAKKKHEKKMKDGWRWIQKRMAMLQSPDYF